MNHKLNVGIAGNSGVGTAALNDLGPLHRHDDSLAALNNREQMLGPQVQSFSLLPVIGRAVIDSSDAAFVARNVVDNRLDDVRLHNALRLARRRLAVVSPDSLATLFSRFAMLRCEIADIANL